MITKRAEVRESSLSPNRPWMVEYHENGKRRRVFRETNSSAREFANEINMKLGPAGDLESYVQAEQILNQVGMGGKILDVVIEWVNMRGDLKERVSRPVHVIIDELTLIDARKLLEGALRTKSHKNNEMLLSRVLSAFEDKGITDITPEAVNEWLDNATTLSGKVNTPISLTTRHHYQAAITRVLKHSVAKGYIPSFDFTEIRTPKKRRKKTVDFYTLDELRLILNKLIGHPSELLGFVTLQLFCGIRSEEIWEPDYNKPLLKWAHLNFDERSISLSEDMDKKGYRRFIQNMPEIAWEWLALARQDDDKTVAPPGLRRRRGNFFREIGVPYRQNGFRYSCATYYANGTQDEHKTATLLRHQGTAMLLQHYLGRENPQGYISTKAKGEDFLSLRPGIPYKDRETAQY